MAYRGRSSGSKRVKLSAPLPKKDALAARRAELAAKVKVEKK